MYLILLALLVATTASAQQAAPARWRLSERPVLAVGAVEGDAAALFGRIAGAVRLRSGALMVADGISLDVRLYSSSGELVQTAGGRGNGPGEFQTILSARRCSGDSVYVYDPALGRISVFSPQGEFTRTITVAESSGTNRPPYEFFCNDAGVVVYLHRSAEPPARIGPRRPDVAITVADHDGFRAELGTFPASERYFDGTNDFPRPLGHVTSVALEANLIYVGTGVHVDDSDAAQVLVMSVDGARMRTLRLDRPRKRVTRGEVTRYVNEQLAIRRGRTDEAALRRLYTGIEYPTYYPAYGRLLADRHGNLWVEDYPVPGAATRGWRVYSADGVRVADLVAPPNFRLMEAGDGYVLGVWRGQFDVPFVHMYALVKQAPGR